MIIPSEMVILIHGIFIHMAYGWHLTWWTLEFFKEYQKYHQVVILLNIIRDNACREYSIILL